MPQSRRSISRRKLLADVAKGIGASSVVAGFPAIVPASVFGATAPSNRINVGAIGTGRISRGHDLPGIWKHDTARIMAVCDLDSKRVEDAKTLVNGYYSKQRRQALRRRHGLRRLPRAARQQGRRRRRHQHARSLARAHRHRRGRGRQGRLPAEAGVADDRRRPRAERRRPSLAAASSRSAASSARRRSSATPPSSCATAASAQLKTVEVGLPGDPSGEDEPEMPVPKNLNYDMWLGSTPVVYYTEKRVHPQAGYDRPGWLRCEQFGAGHDHRLGRAPHRQRALGHGHRVHRARSRSGARRSSRRRACGTSTATSRPKALYANGVHDDRQRRVPERHQVHRHRGLDLRLARQRDGHRERPGREAEGRPGAGGERPEDHHVGHRARRDPPPREQGPPRQLARVHQVAPAADRAGRGRAPLVLGLPAPSHRDEGEAQAATGIPSRSASRTTTRRTRCCRGRSAGRTRSPDSHDRPSVVPVRRPLRRRRRGRRGGRATTREGDDRPEPAPDREQPALPLPALRPHQERALRSRLRAGHGGAPQGDRGDRGEPRGAQLREHDRRDGAGAVSCSRARAASSSG